jgi:hypothetical protein
LIKTIKMVSIEQKGRTKGDKEMSSFYFKTKKRMIAWICAITMVVAGLAVAPKTVVADEKAGTTAVDWSNITEWTRVGETDIYYSITNAKGMFNRVNVVNSELFYFVTNRGGFTATITGPKTDDVVEKTCNGAEIELKKSDFPTDGYYTIDTTKLDGLQIAVKRGSSSSGGGEVSAPKAPTGLEAHIGGGNTFYTIAFAPVDGAKSYKFYLDGEYRQDITNGGTVTVEKLGLKAGKTYKFGVSAVNAAGVESAVTTIDVKVPGKEEGTTTPSFEEGKELIPSKMVNAEITLEKHTVGQTEYVQEHKAESIHIESGKWYVGQFTITSSVRKYFEIRVQDAAAEYVSIPANTEFKKVLVEAGQTVNVRVRFKADRTTDSAIFDICMGYIKEESEAGKVQITNNSLKGYTNEPEATKYTVSIDGTEKPYEEGATITVPTEGQGYYDVTEKVAYAPGTSLTVNKNMTLKSIELNVTMTPGASIRLAAPTGLRFQTTVKSGNGIDADEILNSTTVTTGTLITTLDLYKDNGKTLTKDSKYNFLDIANNGWFNDGAKTETGKFCGSIIKIQSKNYGRAYIAVGYATINYSNGDPKTVYAEVTVNNAKSIKYVANKVKASEKFSGYTAEQKAIINKYIDGKEISE